MAFSIVQHAFTNTTTNPTSVTLTNPVTSGNMVVMWLLGFAGSGVIGSLTPTDNKGGTTYTAPQPLYRSTTFPTLWGQAYYALNVTTGPQTFTVTGTGAGSNTAIYVTEITPSGTVDATPAIAESAPSSGNWTGPTITTTAAGDFIYLGIFSQVVPNITGTLGGTFAIIDQTTSGASGTISSTSSSTKAVAGTIIPSGTITAFNTIVSQAMAFSLAAAPVVTGATFNVISPFLVNQTVGTVSAINTPTSWAITAGDPAGNFAINASGVITNVNQLQAIGSETLTVQATNATGSGTGAVIVNWTQVAITPVTAVNSHPNANGAFTFSNVPIGTQTSDRIVYLVIGQNTVGRVSHVNTVTVGGVSATRLVASASGTGAGGVGVYVEGWAATGVSGTAANIVLTNANGVSGTAGSPGFFAYVSLGVYAITGAGPAPFASVFRNLVQSAADPFTLGAPLAVVSGGVGIAGFVADSSFTVTWNTPTSGDLTVNFGTGVANFTSCQIMTAHINATATPSESGQNQHADCAAIGVSFGPTGIVTSVPLAQNLLQTSFW